MTILLNKNITSGLFDLMSNSVTYVLVELVLSFSEVFLSIPTEIKRVFKIKFVWYYNDSEYFVSTNYLK